MTPGTTSTVTESTCLANDKNDRQARICQPLLIVGVSRRLVSCGLIHFLDKDAESSSAKRVSFLSVGDVEGGVQTPDCPEGRRVDSESYGNPKRELGRAG